MSCSQPGGQPARLGRETGTARGAREIEFPTALNATKFAVHNKSVIPLSLATHATPPPFNVITPKRRLPNPKSWHLATIPHALLAPGSGSGSAVGLSLCLAGWLAHSLLPCSLPINLSTSLDQIPYCIISRLASKCNSSLLAYRQNETQHLEPRYRGTKALRPRG